MTETQSHAEQARAKALSCNPPTQRPRLDDQRQKQGNAVGLGDLFADNDNF